MWNEVLIPLNTLNQWGLHSLCFRKSTENGLKRLSAEYSKFISARVNSISQTKLIDASMVD
jgi:hypothetical protein